MQDNYYSLIGADVKKIVDEACLECPPEVLDEAREEVAEYLSTAFNDPVVQARYHAGDRITLCSEVMSGRGCVTFVLERPRS